MADVSQPTIENYDFSTPMMQQYLEIKKDHQDCLLWFRLGDFYEMFLEDAHIGSEVLGITLTSRSRGKDGRIPMAGIPYHAADTYLAKLIRAGHKVAICEQITEPDGKNLVEREVIRIVTPGTLLDEKNLQRKENNYVMSIILKDHVVAMALADISTGEVLSSEFLVEPNQSPQTIIEDVITQFAPKECIIAPDDFQNGTLTNHIGTTSMCIFPFLQWADAVAQPRKVIKKYIPNFSNQHFLAKQDLAQVATAAVLSYLQVTQKKIGTHLKTILPLTSDEFLHLDRSTMMNLELFSTLRENTHQGSLLQVLDHTHTAMGGRLLRRWLTKPLANPKHIQKRLDAVEFLVAEKTLRETLRTHLKEIIDIERLLGRVSFGLGNPRDLKNLELSLHQCREVRDLLVKMPKELLKELGKDISPTLAEITTSIQQTLTDHPPVDPKHGGVIQTGISTELDELRQVINHSEDWMQSQEQTERQKTGISSLKIKYNQVFGYYIEVSKANADKVPHEYFRKQTLVNAERFTTPELKHHEEIILQAKEKVHVLEEVLFTKLVDEVLMQIIPLKNAAQAIAQVDCVVSFATVAEMYRYTKPLLTEAGEMEIHEGRHPVVERLISPKKFIPNDVCLNTMDQQLLLITGPNMAGKSVLMRQVALITLLAHMGSFVPATKATISITDQIFVRSGAADMITAGQSTFMVEMVETAYILQHATDRSLIIMDEIGRGTSTYDGISIAWAVAEYLVRNPQGPKTLFATHYHELQTLADEHPQKMRNVHMAITHHKDSPIFLYTLIPGGASHSFGVAVAALAGVPKPVVERAKILLTELEQHQPGEGNSQPLQHPPTQDFIDPSTMKILEALEKVSIDETPPLEALNILSRLKKLLPTE